MFVVDEAAYVRAAAAAMLAGAPFESLANWAARQRAEEEAAKVLCFTDWRSRLRPPAIAAAEPKSVA